MPGFPLRAGFILLPPGRGSFQYHFGGIETRKTRKTPMLFAVNYFAFASIWDHRQGEGGEELESCAIITTEANSVLRDLHDRMPVILGANDVCASSGWGCWRETPCMEYTPWGSDRQEVLLDSGRITTSEFVSWRTPANRHLLCMKSSEIAGVDQ
jgi:hypothetical protein